VKIKIASIHVNRLLRKLEVNMEEEQLEGYVEGQTWAYFSSPLYRQPLSLNLKCQ
jgi:hypothetical protein